VGTLSKVLQRVLDRALPVRTASLQQSVCEVKLAPSASIDPPSHHLLPQARFVAAEFIRMWRAAMCQGYHELRGMVRATLRVHIATSGALMSITTCQYHHFGANVAVDLIGIGALVCLSNCHILDSE
jgi:hypothetical protein